MHYYEIWVGSQRFHSDKPLTYSSQQKLSIGEVVEVPLRNKQVMGFIAKQVTLDISLVAKIKSINAASGVILPAQSRQLHTWLTSYYPAPTGTTTNLFMPPSLPKDTKEHPATDKLKSKTSSTLPTLTDEQEQAINQILAGESQTTLLHGGTGTGKTRVYIELVRNAIRMGQSAIILTPEIGLTTQLARDLSAVFPTQVLVIHSNLTPAKRRDIWYNIASTTEPLIVIGPRSALFVPLQNVGVIAVDEAHEQAYKQEQAPYYQATRVAAQLARLHNAQCILGTATPLATDYYLFEQKKMPIIRMEKNATGTITPPEITIIDLKNRDETKRSTIISATLIQEIQKTSEAGKQTLLFLNRRGSARMILCHDCGWQALCPHCDIALTYHDDEHSLRCHTCGFRQNAVTKCPSCEGNEILYQTPGTKSLEEEVKNLFPHLVSQRFDGDNVAADKLERHFKSLVEGGVDIIIGTQLVTKGLDLPQLGLVGIINADASLNFPDYTAEEKTYQLLSQVIGRVGRHQKSSTVVIQTYNPDNPLFTIIRKKDWRNFLDQQLLERQQFGFPPFYHLLQLKVARASRSSAQTTSQKLVDQIRTTTRGVIVRGPSPQLHEKVRGTYNWQVIVSAKQRQKLLDIIAYLPNGWLHNIDPSDLM